LSRIEKYGFSETGLIEIILPSSVKALDESCFMSANHFVRLHLNQGQDCHKLKSRHSLELV
jgi:hypothetical protein